ncbi:MAG: zinc ribbon domain-containing protein [Coriobacteriales bacterium]|nr:zinc ribbon domain-containing protein [Coriobacteriales bacterium]
MAFCGSCGTQVQGGVRFCPTCGKEIAAQTQQTGAPNYAPSTVPGAPTQGNFNDAEANKGMAVIAYILFFVPLLTGAHKTSPFVRYHTNQGTILFILALAWGVASNILHAILRLALLNVFTWGIYGPISMLLSALWLVPLVFCILGIINAVNGKTAPLPIIGDKFSIIK